MVCLKTADELATQRAEVFHIAQHEQADGIHRHGTVARGQLKRFQLRRKTELTPGTGVPANGDDLGFRERHRWKSGFFCGRCSARPAQQFAFEAAGEQADIRCCVKRKIGLRSRARRYNHLAWIEKSHSWLGCPAAVPGAGRPSHFAVQDTTDIPRSALIVSARRTTRLYQARDSQWGASSQAPLYWRVGTLVMVVERRALEPQASSPRFGGDGFLVLVSTLLVTVAESSSSWPSGFWTGRSRRPHARPV